MLGSISTCFQFHVNFFPCAHLGHISHARDHSTCIIVALSILSLHHVFTFLLCYAPPFLLSVSPFIILPPFLPSLYLKASYFRSDLLFLPTLYINPSWPQMKM